MDLRQYPEPKTQDSVGTEADVRRILGSGQDMWEGFRLRVLTQNLWGIPVVSQCLEARVHTVCSTLGRWDVVAFQEVWHARERDALRRAAVMAGLRYARHFEPGCGVPLLGPGCSGTGLLVVSRYPITESTYQRYLVNGLPYRLQHMDYMGAKGVGLVHLCTPAGAVDIYVTHLHAHYDRAAGTPDRYKAHRVAQAFQLAHFVRLTSRSPLALVMGDLNSEPSDLGYGLQRSVAGLRDAFEEARPGDAGNTCQALDCVFSNGRDAPARIDYVLFGTKTSLGGGAAGGQSPPPFSPGGSPAGPEPLWELTDCWVQKDFLDREAAEAVQVAVSAVSGVAGGGRGGGGCGGGIPVSDHYGVAAEFVATNPDADIDIDDQPLYNTRGGGASASASAPPVDANGGSGGRSTGGGGHTATDATGQRPSLLSDPPGVSQRPSLEALRSMGNNFPPGPLVAKALSEVDRGIEEAVRRQQHHLSSAKVLLLLWAALAAAGAALGQPLGPLPAPAASACASDAHASTGGAILLTVFLRAAVGVWGGAAAAGACMLFLGYWFAAREEVNGLREAYMSMKNYDSHLAMEEAFPDQGFDTSQLQDFMDTYFR